MNNKKFDVVVVGELNVDLILNNIESFPEIGKEKLAKDMTLTLGSSSAIFASNLSSLGAKVAFLGKIGNDYFGKLILDKLSEKGVDVSLIVKDKNSNTGATIVLNFFEDRAMITYPGAMNNLTIKDITKTALGQAKHLHFSSYYLQPGIKNDVDKMFKIAKDIGMTTSFDMQWDPEEKWKLNYKKVLPFVDVFLPNEQEILHLTKEDSISNALKKLSNVSNKIVVKMGSKGSLLKDKEKIIKKEPFLNKNVVDAIGAGDSFNAGFIFKFINGSESEECQEFGNLMGAVNTTAAGGTTAFKDYKTIMKIAKEKFGFKKK
jgi:sugar/nucleoside kinase (ribokinase family)